MDRMIFINLPVRDVRASRAFWSALGFGVNEQFSDERTACLELGGSIYAMLLEESRFADFSPLPVADAFATKEVLNCLSCSSREEVDDLVARAIAAGGKAWQDKLEQGPMYGGSFQDIDGHVWELMHMDLSGSEPPADAAAPAPTPA